MLSTKHHKHLFIFTLLALLIYLLCQFLKIQYSPDDTFIYLQYAKNISRGFGFTFNEGEPSYGVTSPLWSIILSVSFFTGVDGYWFAKILDLLFSFAAMYFFYQLLNVLLDKVDEDMKPWFISFGMISFILNSWFVRWSFTGMETSLALLLVVGIFLNYYRKKFYLCYLLMGLLFLVRPESFVLVIAITSVLIFHKVKFLSVIKYLLIALIVILPWLIYAYFVFETIIPNTAIGKATFSFSLQIIFDQMKKITGTIAFSSILEIILSFVFFFVAYKRKLLNFYSVMFIWIVGLLVLYIVTDSDIISRYLLLVTPIFTLLSVLALKEISYKPKLITIFLIILVFNQTQFIFFRYVKPHTDNFSYGVDKCFIEIGSWLNSNTPENSRILVNDVGAIGYYSKRYIIDAAALINGNLELNKKIMSTPVNERESTANLLSFIDADYLVQRDSYPENKLKSVSGKKLEFIFMKEFPGLGISDPSPKYYKVYKVICY